MASPNAQSYLALLDKQVAGALPEKGKVPRERNLLDVLAAKGPDYLLDIPAYTQAFALLRHALESYPLEVAALEDLATQDVRPGCWVDCTPVDEETAGGADAWRVRERLLVTVPVDAGMIAHLLPPIPSATLCSQPGHVTLAYSILRPDRPAPPPAYSAVLLPEWFAVFYPTPTATTPGMPLMPFYVPILVLSQVLSDPRFEDWVGIAVSRMPLYGMPRSPKGIPDRHAVH